MRRSLLLAALLLLGCSNLLFRSGRDYFPLVRGSLWKYFDGTDTCYVEVGRDSLVGGRSGTIVYTDFAPGLWVKPTPESEVRQWVRRTLLRGGTEHVLEERYALVYLLPLVTGNSWSDEYSDTIIILGTDTLRYRHRLEVRVAAIEPVTVPAGEFEECYRLEFTRTVVAEAESTASYTEWLAPDVGLVRRSSGGRVIELAEYRIGP
ncbi:MAG: hypothetical protein R6X14_02785 [bacterium]